jgi:[ribosomal protein S5]-alanine N-acetyltransferase
VIYVKMPVELNPPTVIGTARLLLRKPVLTDAEPLFDAYISKPEIPRYMSWLAHTDIGQTQTFLENCIAGWADHTNFEFVIERKKAPGVPIGMIGMHPLKHTVGFGYVIAKEFWNCGYTSEALKGLVDWSLQQPYIFRAQAFCDVENPASARVMEKAGMQLEGILRRYFVHPNLSNEPRDSLMYAKVR